MANDLDRNKLTSISTIKSFVFALFKSHKELQLKANGNIRSIL